MNKQKILKNTSLQVFSVGISGILSVLQTIIVANLLGPTLYGVIQGYRLIISYTAYADIGTLWAMVREISFFRGTNESEKQNEIKNITFTINSITFFITSVLVFLFFLLKERSGLFKISDAAIVSAIIFFQFLFNYSTHYFVATKKFSSRSLLIILFPLMNIIFIFLFGIKYSLSGVLCAMLLAYMLSVLYSGYQNRLNLKFYFSFSKIILLIKKGLPICGNGLLGILTSNIDRIMVLWLLPIEALGFYGIGVMLRSFIETLYRSVYLTIFPYIAEKYGETKNPNTIRGYVLKPIIISSYLTPFVFGPLILLIPLIFNNILPQFIAGIYPTQIIIASCFFSCLQVGVINFFITLNKIHYIYPIRIFTVIFCSLCIFIAIKSNFHLEGVAYSFLASTFILSTLLIHKLLNYYSILVFSEIKQYIFTYFPFFYMIGALYITTFLNLNLYSGLYNELINIGTKILLFYFLSTPLFLVLNFNTGFFSMITNEITSYIRK